VISNVSEVSNVTEVPVHTVHSQYPNVCMSCSMECKLILFINYEPHTLSLRPFKFVFPTASLIFAASKLVHQVIENNEASIIAAVDMKL